MFRDRDQSKESTLYEEEEPSIPAQYTKYTRTNMVTEIQGGFRK